VIQAVGIDQVPRLIDAFSIVVKENFTSAHTDRIIRFHTGDQLFEPALVGLRVVIQCRDVAAFRNPDTGIAAPSKPVVRWQGNDAQARFANAV